MISVLRDSGCLWTRPGTEIPRVKGTVGNKIKQEGPQNQRPVPTAARIDPGKPRPPDLLWCILAAIPAYRYEPQKEITNFVLKCTRSWVLRENLLCQNSSEKHRPFVFPWGPLRESTWLSLTHWPWKQNAEQEKKEKTRLKLSHIAPAGCFPEMSMWGLLQEPLGNQAAFRRSGSTRTSRPDTQWLMTTRSASQARPALEPSHIWCWGLPRLSGHFWLLVS